MDKIGRAGLQTRPGQLAASAIYLDRAVPVSNIPGFFDGEASVQDEASQLVPELLQLAPGLRVLDACAPPVAKPAIFWKVKTHLPRVLLLIGLRQG